MKPVLHEIRLLLPAFLAAALGFAGAAGAQEVPRAQFNTAEERFMAQPQALLDSPPAPTLVSSDRGEAQEAPSAVDAGVIGTASTPPSENHRPYETTVTATPTPAAVPEGRATSHVRRTDMERRLPRSAPDALRYEPGVFVQQSAHGQGSAFIRGLTGQQTLLLFDGIRLNNSTYRQGPNQYFFTLDSQTLQSIEVLRGGASTQYGTDAFGGVIAARPIEPRMLESATAGHAKLLLRGATADKEYGGRAQVEGVLLGKVGFIGGIGGRRVGLLESSGAVLNPLDGKPSEVPQFMADGRTQLGTGFDEITADGRLVYEPAENQRLTLAGYVYRQYDAPRTDQCPPPAARFDECLKYDEQFRTLVYGAWEGALGPLAEKARAILSWQRQHERRTLSRPASFVLSPGRDDVDAFGATLRVSTVQWKALPWLSLRTAYGVDTYFDRVTSRAWIEFTDIGATLERSRGQYLDGSTSLYGGAFLEPEVQLFDRVVLRVGGRISWISTDAHADVESGSQPIHREWFPLVGHAGIEWAAFDALSVLANVDRSFRAPNLDDLTSRQQTGPGFQFENPGLEPEQATTLEAGLRWRSRFVSAEFWAFTTLLDGAVGRVPREMSDCPPQTPECAASWFRYQLVNAKEQAEIRGFEVAGMLRLPYNLNVRTAVSWAWGEGPNLAEPPSDPALLFERRVPLSRIPPLNGTVEIQWTHPSGIGAGSVIRWTATQDRLAIADRSDSRIPLGGTPGFVVLDLRVSYRLKDQLAITGVFENVLDTPYRYHGSSVNGPGRGATLQFEYSPL